MGKTRFSVIVAVYNTRLDYIRYALSSVMNLNYDNYEVIIVDDGSNADVKQLLNDYEDRCIIKHQENMGGVKAFLEGIKIASGEYIVFVDFDDYIQPEALNIFDSILEENKTDVIMFDFVRFTNRIEDAKPLIPYLKKGPISKNEALKELCLLHTSPLWRKTARRELYLGMEDAIDTSLRTGDVQMTTYLFLNADTFYYTDDLIYYYRTVMEHRSYYQITDLNDFNFLVPVYRQLFENNDRYNNLLPFFVTSMANTIVYNAFRACLWIENKKEKYALLDDMNRMKITEICNSIKERKPLITGFLYHLFIRKHYFLLNILAHVYDLIYGMQRL